MRREKLNDLQKFLAEILCRYGRYAHFYTGECVNATAGQVGRYLRSQGIHVREERAGLTETAQREARRLMREARPKRKRRKAG